MQEFTSRPPRNTPRTAATAVAVAGLLAAAACVPAGGHGASPAPATGGTVADPGRYAQALDQLNQLLVKPEDTGAHYDRDDWKHWTTTNGCTTRQLVIKRDAQPVNPSQPVQYGRCEATGNARWVSLYDNVPVTKAADLEVDHWVPLKQMAVSHTREWTPKQREQYANDPDVLIAVTGHSNGQKSSQDPATWSVPDNPAFGCDYQAKWVAIKLKYSTVTGHPVTVDPAEKAALQQKLTLCAKGARR